MLMGEPLQGHSEHPVARCDAIARCEQPVKPPHSDHAGCDQLHAFLTKVLQSRIEEIKQRPTLPIIMVDSMWLVESLAAIGHMTIPRTNLGVGFRYFLTCQVRVVRLSPPAPPCSSRPLRRPQPRVVFPAGPQLRGSRGSVPRRTSTARVTWQCAPPDLNCEGRVAVCPAGPQLRGSRGSVPRRTSTARVAWQCSPPDLNRELRRAVFPAGPQPRVLAGNVPHRTSTSTQPQLQPHHNHKHAITTTKLTTMATCSSPWHEDK